MTRRIDRPDRADYHPLAAAPWDADPTQPNCDGLRSPGIRPGAPAGEFDARDGSGAPAPGTDAKPAGEASIRSPPRAPASQCARMFRRGHLEGTADESICLVARRDAGAHQARVQMAAVHRPPSP